MALSQTFSVTAHIARQVDLSLNHFEQVENVHSGNLVASPQESRYSRKQMERHDRGQ